MLDGLLPWFEPRRAAYPWRLTSNPYAVLVSEVMLQQTQASRVAPVFERFMVAFPDVQALAAAPVAEVVRTWSGLGYNRRAVALSMATRALVRDHGGRVPADQDALARLPGVGPYTAAAVASLAFGRATPAVDTNLRRVVARALLGKQPDGVRTADVRAAAQEAIDRDDPGAWNQALMDLGREVCRPTPRCPVCPIAPSCRFAQERRTGALRRRAGLSFEGSRRQLRGRVVRTLTEGSTTLGRLSKQLGQPLQTLVPVVERLARDGLVDATPGALAGRPGGRVALAEDEPPAVGVRPRTSRRPPPPPSP